MMVIKVILKISPTDNRSTVTMLIVIQIEMLMVITILIVILLINNGNCKNNIIIIKY